MRLLLFSVWYAIQKTPGIRRFGPGVGRWLWLQDHIFDEHGQAAVVAVDELHRRI